MNIAINGFGRIGRLVFRNLIDRKNVNIVAINDLSDSDTLAHLLKYDTAHGKFKYEVDVSDNQSLNVNGKNIKSYAVRNPEELPWGELDIDIVIECTGVFRTEELASKHIVAGAKRVLLSAPPKSDGIQTIVLGVNDKDISTSQKLFSNASCTTNCLAPQIKLLDEKWGIVDAFMTTTHAVTSSQNIQDGPHKDLRRARAANYNIIPTSTGAAKATEIVYPAIKGKLDAISIRVPILVGSLTETTFLLEEEVTIEEINTLFKEAAEKDYKGLIQYSTAPLVSSDIVGNKHSAIFDSSLTNKQGKLYKVISWYDNESGYSARLADLAIKLGSLK